MIVLVLRLFEIIHGASFYHEMLQGNGWMMCVWIADDAVGDDLEDHEKRLGTSIV